MRKQTTKTAGYSLVEVLVSIAVLLIAIVGPMTIAAQGIKTAAFTLEQNTAFFLAQEGIEAMFALRGDYFLQYVKGDVPNAWDWVSDELDGTGPCNISGGDSCLLGAHFDSSGVQLTGSTCDDPDNCRLYTEESDSPFVYTHDSAGDESPYTRIITVEENSANTLDITSTITWNSAVFGGAEQTVEAHTRIFDLSS